MLLQDYERTKLDVKSKMCIYLGLKADTKGFKLWSPETKKVLIKRDVVGI